jgi:glycosyltransferase involved in cell wall biosynthesis
MGFRFTLSRRIEFEGMVAGEKKISLLQGSKGLVFPVRWHEPFGLAVIESLFMGCPVFGTPYGSLPELVNNDVGFLSNNHQSLAEQVENCEQFDRGKCHQYASELFNSRKMALAYLAKYEQVLNGNQLNESKPKLKQQTAKFLEWD